MTAYTYRTPYDPDDDSTKTAANGWTDVGIPPSHYPTSAELAAFRRSIRPTLPVPLSMVAWLPTSDRADAWPHELRNGIGYRIAQGMPRGLRGAASRYDAYYARREAAAMRSRAYLYQHGTSDWWGYVDGDIEDHRAFGFVHP